MATLQMQPVLGSVGSSSSQVELIAAVVQLPEHVTFLPAVTALQPTAPPRDSGRNSALAARRLSSVKHGTSMLVLCILRPRAS